jgi:alanine-synthesizing transaminase
MILADEPAAAQSAVRVAARLSGFSYAIRNIAAEAQKLEAAGRTVRYLNIGDPILFGFTTPPHLVEAVERAIQDGHSGYTPSPGIPQAREAVAAELTSRGLPMSADRVVVTSGASEGIELALTALVDPGDEVLVPCPTYPLYTAVLAKLGARPVAYPTHPEQGFAPDPDEMAACITSRTRAVIVIDPNNPTGAVYPQSLRRGILRLADRHGLVVLADEVYADLAFSGPIAPLGSLDPDGLVLSFSSLSKGYLAPGWRAGWVGVGRTSRLDGLLAAIKKLADGRLCSAAPTQYAIVAALSGDRSHQQVFRAALAERAALVTSQLTAPPNLTCIAPSAAFYAMPRVALPAGRTDEQFVIELLRATGILCVHGSGFGMSPSEGFFRIVFLPPPAELAETCAAIGAFAGAFSSSGALPRPGET